jgi:hypothetical protein
VRRQEVPEPEAEPDEADELDEEDAAVEDEDESLLGAGVVLEDDESPDDFSDALGASVELLPARESVR